MTTIKHIFLIGVLTLLTHFGHGQVLQWENEHTEKQGVFHWSGAVVNVLPQGATFRLGLFVEKNSQRDTLINIGSAIYVEGQNLSIDLIHDPSGALGIATGKRIITIVEDTNSKEIDVLEFAYEFGNYYQFVEGRNSFEVDSLLSSTIDFQFPNAFCTNGPVNFLLPYGINYRYGNDTLSASSGVLIISSDSIQNGAMMGSSIPVLIETDFFNLNGTVEVGPDVNSMNFSSGGDIIYHCPTSPLNFATSQTIAFNTFRQSINLPMPIPITSQFGFYETSLEPRCTKSTSVMVQITSATVPEADIEIVPEICSQLGHVTLNEFVSTVPLDSFTLDDDFFPITAGAAVRGGTYTLSVIDTNSCHYETGLDVYVMETNEGCEGHYVINLNDPNAFLNLEFEGDLEIVDDRGNHIQRLQGPATWGLTKANGRQVEVGVYFLILADGSTKSITVLK